MHSAAHVSNEAKGFIRELLLLDPEFRMTAAECLKHPWLTGDDKDGGDVLKTLETSWMKQGQEPQCFSPSAWHLSV